VRDLLGRGGAGPGRPDICRTPFWFAGENGHERVVKIQLERKDVCPDQSDSDGQTPLWWVLDFDGGDNETRRNETRNAKELTPKRSHSAAGKKLFTNLATTVSRSTTPTRYSMLNSLTKGDHRSIYPQRPHIHP